MNATHDAQGQPVLAEVRRLGSRAGACHAANGYRLQPDDACLDRSPVDQHGVAVWLPGTAAFAAFCSAYRAAYRRAYDGTRG